MIRRTAARALVVMALVAAGCRSEPPPAAKLPPRMITGWRETASWKGRGNAQLDSFAIDSWDWRIRWETKNESPAGSGTFHVETHSADSGRIIAVPVDARGVGHDTVNVNELPHRYYLVVDSKNVDWTMVVEEAVLSP
jgi:hypothetical protein